MPIAWNEIFENFGVKTVTKTDKSKAAYVLNKAQLAAVDAAGLKPSTKRPADPFDVTLLFDSLSSIGATYYHAMREDGRGPEPRLGTDFISLWLKQGDQVVIGNIGSQLYAARIPSSDVSDIEAAAAVARKAKPASKEKLILNAKKAKGKPAKRIVSRNDFVRNPAVVMGAIARAGGKCEMPGCVCNLFLRDDDSPYLEVHHVQPLGEDGEDSLTNAAALCPHCHRILHFGKDRVALRDVLAAHIAAVTV